MAKSKLEMWVNQFNEGKRSLVIQARSLFLDASKKLFDEYPELESFGWEQYAPYFNDGEPCTFSVNADYPTINGYDSNCGRFKFNPDGTDIDEDIERELTNEEEKFHESVTKPIAKLINTLPDDIMQEVFGDDTRVTITRSGKVINGETNHD